MSLNRYEIASIKRTAQNVKVLRKKLSRQDLIIEKAMQEKKALEEEISLWEAPLVSKYNMTSEEILRKEDPSQTVPEQEAQENPESCNPADAAQQDSNDADQSSETPDFM